MSADGRLSLNAMRKASRWIEEAKSFHLPGPYANWQFTSDTGTLIHCSLCAQKLKNRLKLWIRVELERFRNDLQQDKWNPMNILTRSSQQLHHLQTPMEMLLSSKCVRYVKHNTKNVSIWKFVNWSRTKHLVQSHVLMPQCKAVLKRNVYWPNAIFFVVFFFVLRTAIKCTFDQVFYFPDKRLQNSDLRQRSSSFGAAECW